MKKVNHFLLIIVRSTFLILLPALIDLVYRLLPSRISLTILSPISSCGLLNSEKLLMTISDIRKFFI